MFEKLSQNKRIAVSAVALFLVSFCLMLFFLDNGDMENELNQASVINLEHEDEGGVSEVKPESFYREYLADKSAPFFVTNAEGVVVYSSDEFNKLLDVRNEDFVGNPLFDYMNSKDLSRAVADYTKLIQDAKNVEGIGPYRMLKKNSEVMLMLNTYPVLDKKGRVSQIIFSAKDLTEQIEELNNGNRKYRDWIEELYPKIDETEDEGRMVVEKVG